MSSVECGWLRSSNGFANGYNEDGIGAEKTFCASDWLGISSTDLLAEVLVRGCRVSPDVETEPEADSGCSPA